MEQFNKGAESGNLPQYSNNPRRMDQIRKSKRSWGKIFMFLGVIVVIILIICLNMKVKNKDEEIKEIEKLNTQYMSDADLYRTDLHDKQQKLTDLMKQRDSLNKDIDQYSKSRTQKQDELDSLSKSVNSNKGKVDELQAQLDMINAQLTDVTSNNDIYLKNIKKIEEDIDYLKEKLSKKQEEERPERQQVFDGVDSKILKNEDLLYNLRQMFPESRPLRLLLVYRASEDGYSPDKFHRYVDDVQKTLTVIKTADGDIIGGYTENNWSGEGFKEDNNAFIFNLGRNTKYTPSDPRRATYCSPGYMSVFGQGDLAMTYDKNYSNFPISYGGEGRNEPLELTNGKENIEPAEYEVFSVEYDD